MNLSRRCDAILDWGFDHVMPVVMVILMPILVIGAIGAIGLCATMGVMAWHDFAPASWKGVKTETIQPRYWACTAVYMQHIHGGGTLTRFGRTSEYDYHECTCKQWSAYMVGEPHPADAQCSNGAVAAELRGVR